MAKWGHDRLQFAIIGCFVRCFVKSISIIYHGVPRSIFSPTAHQQINISKYAFYLAAPLNHRRLPGVRMRKVSLLQNPCLLQGFTWNKSASSPIFDQSLSYVYIDYYFFTCLYTKDAFQSYLARKMSLWCTQYNSFFIVLCLYDTAINHESCRYVPLLVLIDSYQSVFFNAR